MEQAELAEISRSFRSAMGESAGQFRQAARENGANLEKIVKDLSRSFKAQSNQIAELSNSLDETAHETQLTVDRIDRLNSAVQESLSVQSSMLNELKNITIGMRSLSGSINTLDNNLQTSLITGGANSLLGGVTGKLGLMQTAIVGALAGIVVGGGAKTAYDYLAGAGGAGAGGTSDFQWGSGPENTNMKAAAEAIKSIESKGSGGYQAQNPSSSASGAYQFIDSTWKSAAAAAGIGTEYKRAVDAPPKVQDAVFNDYFQKLVAKEGLKGAVLTHFLGPKHTISAEAQAKNITPESYLNKFQKVYAAQSSESSTQTAETSTNSTTPVSQSPVTPGATTPQQTTEASSANAPRTEPIGGEHGHGPISSATAHGMDISKVKLIEHYGPGRPDRPEESILNIAKKAAAATGMESITATSGKGNYISPAGRAKGQKTTMHSTGLAVDLAGFTDDKQKLEFIKNAKAAGAKGVGVYDNGSVHIDLGRERSWNWGMKDDAGFKAALGAGTAAAPQGDAVANMGPEMRNIGPPMPASIAQSVPAQSAPTSEQAQATPVEQSPVSPGVAAPVTAPDMGAMMGMMSGMMPGGMGGIVGMLAPMLMSAISSIPSPAAAAQSLENIPNQDPIAELLSSLSGSAMNSQIVSEAAVQKQAQQEESMIQLTDMQESRNVPPVSADNVSFNNPAPGYNYNMPWDTGWPDWLDALGGVNYSEMKSIKTSFR